MKIVAFLQNMWVLPHQVQTVSRCHPVSDQRERMIHYSLFAGCTTGRRLKATLGEELCQIIKWQEANPTVASNPRDYYAPDPDHILAVMQKHKPEIVLCFTRAGEDVIRDAVNCQAVLFLAVPHPACRRVSETLANLKRIRVVIESFIQDDVP